MRALLAALAACWLTSPALAASVGGARDLGLGIVLGTPSGATGKYWLSSSRAVDFGVGSDGDLTVYGDYHLLGWDVFPKAEGVRIGAYAGAGAAMIMLEDDSELALRIPVGITFLPNRYSLELFFELVPVVGLLPHSGSDLDAGLGFRFYFSK